MKCRTCHKGIPKFLQENYLRRKTRCPYCSTYISKKKAQEAEEAFRTTTEGMRQQAITDNEEKK